MPKKILLGLTIMLALVGCGNKDENATKDKASVGEVVSGISKLNDMADTTKGLEKHIAELKKMSSITNDQFKSVLPENLGGIERTSFEVNNSMGLQTVGAEFKKETQYYELNIYDGAGEMGSAMYGMAALAGAMGTESESQTGYTKPFSIGDNQGSEKQDKTNPENVSNEVTLAVANRFVLTVKSVGMDMDSLKDAIKNSNIINKLESLK